MVLGRCYKGVLVSGIPKLHACVLGLLHRKVLGIYSLIALTVVTQVRVRAVIHTIRQLPGSGRM